LQQQLIFYSDTGFTMNTSVEGSRKAVYDCLIDLSKRLAILQTHSWFDADPLKRDPRMQFEIDAIYAEKAICVEKLREIRRFVQDEEHKYDLAFKC